MLHINCTLSVWINNPEESNNPYITISSIAINCFLIHLCAIVGTFGNAVAIIILSRKTFTDTSSVILLSMAACDLFFLVNLSVCKLNCIINMINPVIAEIYYPYIVSFIRRPSRLAMFLSVSHTVVISCERLLSVFFPLHVSQWITRKTTKRILVFIYCAWTAYVTPYAVFNYQIEWTFNSNYNQTMPTFRETQWFLENKPVFDLLTHIVINNITVLFTVIVAVNSCAISYRLNTVSKQRKLITSTNKNRSQIDVKASRMLLAVCVVYNVCNIPSSAIYLHFNIDSSLEPSNKLYMLLSDLEEMMMAINAAANFFVYTFMSGRFYRSVLRLIGCGRLVK
ncbi:unnamed protein product [Candidula unifasciata]|uniref:G-protein coupled receptors family 1 profile domain-containing protein n=1 Tax=Candidula unifasciata TaxID=100452 RepID=A0A8S3Z1V2_9EUPU|nr:unnamed protein product [Candidula unifasciata]